MIPIFLLISVVIGTISVFLYLSPTNCSGFGCIAPEAILTLPIYPTIALIDFLTIDFASGILKSPTILKFIPVFFIFVNSFIFGLLFMVVLIAFRKKHNGEKLNRVKYATKKFLLYFLVWVIVFSAFIAVKYPLKPFLSDNEIITICKTYNYVKQDRNECLINYIVYKLPNCENRIQSFYYPFNLYSSETDICILDNFITRQPFKYTELSQSWYSSYSFKFKGKYPGSHMGTLLDFFDSLLINVDSEKKAEFCNSFSSQSVSQNRGIYYSNQDWCMEHFELAPISN